MHILASNVRNAIREEIRDAKFFILVNETRDESKRKQMAIILRFVEKEGFIKERFFHVVPVRDTIALTLKNEICAVLSHYNLHIENIRSQGYDGLVTCVVNGMDYKLFFLRIVYMLIMYIVWHIGCISSYSI